MGVLLTPITVRHPTSLDALRGRTIAVDGNLELYQFLSIMRTRDGQPRRGRRHGDGVVESRHDFASHASDGGRGEDAPDAHRNPVDPGAQ